MSKFKCIFFVMCATLICTISSAQVSDSIPVKTSIFSKLNFSKIHLPKFNFYKKDSSNSKSNEIKEKKAASIAVERVKDTAKKASFLAKLRFNKRPELKADTAIVVAPVVEKAKDTSSIYKAMKEKFLKYTATTTVSLLAGANFSKQIVNAGDYNSNFNYIYSDINNDVYKTGYFGGIRLDGMFKKKHEYSLGLSFSKFSSGASYKTSTSLRPVVGSFSNFKAEDHFFAMNIVAHYKKLIPYGDLDKFKFYIVGGPSIDARLSNTSIDNKVTNAYKQIFFKGDLGFEFNNRSLYTLFFHYQHNIGSITKVPIKTNINTFQIGIMVKAADLL